MRNTLVGLLIVMLTAASCTGQEPDASGQPEQSTTVELGQEEASPDNLAFSDPTSLSEEIRLGLVRPESFLPNEISMLDQGAVIVSDLLFDGLTEADSKAGTLRPALASEWTHDANFTQWSFTIENEARIKPSTIVTHFQRLISTPPSGTTAFILGSITSVSAGEDGNVIFDLVDSNAGFAWMLSGVQFSVVGTDGEFSGRYQVESDSADAMVLDPIVDAPRIAITWTQDESQAYDKMTLSQLDATVVSPEDAPDAKQRFGAEFGDLGVSKFFVLNPRSSLAQSIERREALQIAIDQADLLDGRLPETTVSTSSILSSSLTGARSDDCGVVCQFDSDRAGELFDDEVNDSTIRVGVIWPDQFDVGEEIAEDLTDAGLTAEVVELTSEELTAAVFDGQIEIFSFGWIAGATSIDSVIPAVLGSSSPVEPSPGDAERIDALLSEASTTESDSERWSLLNDAHNEALSIGMILPVSNETHRLVRTPELEDLAVRADGSIDVFGVDLG